MYLLCKFVVLVTIFQDLEHLNDFHTISFGDHFVLQGKVFPRQIICRPGLTIGCFYILKLSDQ